MSYEGISIRDALDNINRNHGGWFLPQVQRQYVWGVRDESEDYICLLLDSILRGYPIGGIVLWETESSVPHRAFLQDYIDGGRAKEVDSGLWARRKSLVYDGQQRLQTLYSVLQYTVNGRVLCFDLLFDRKTHDTDETGFFFVDKGAKPNAGSIRMNFLCAKDDDSEAKEKLKDEFVSEGSYSKDEALTIKANLDKLWSIFVQDNTKTLAYFSVRSNSDREVNEIFRRLNTGGVPLTQIELVLSKIKAKHSSFEANLDALSDSIYAASGIEFSAAEIMQFIFMMVFGTARVDSDRVKESGVDAFKDELTAVADPLKDFFEGYLLGLFNINDRCIIPRGLALLPIMAYFTERYKVDKTKVKHIPSDSIKLIHQYFILSQLNDWNTQTMVTSFVKEAREAAKGGLDFPLENIRAIAVEKHRIGQLRRQAFMSMSHAWFALKVLTPNRQYQFSSTKPQIDHIFPRNLAGKDHAYKEAVDVLWNFQPMPAGINNYKSAKHPLGFFESAEGEKYFKDYDYAPPLESDLWKDEVEFIRARELKMTDGLKSLYGLKFEIEPV